MFSRTDEQKLGRMFPLSDGCRKGRLVSVLPFLPLGRTLGRTMVHTDPSYCRIRPTYVRIEKDGCRSPSYHTGFYGSFAYTVEAKNLGRVDLYHSKGILL